MNKANIIAIVFMFLFAFGLGYLVFEVRQGIIDKETEIFLNGSIYGQQLAVLTILQQASTCQPVAIPFQNRTYNLYLLECEGIGR